MRYTTANTVELGLAVRVFLDDVEMSCVVEADTDQGYIIKHKQNRDGSLVLDRKNDSFAKEKLRGCVRVEPYVRKVAS